MIIPGRKCMIIYKFTEELELIEKASSLLPDGVAYEVVTGEKELVVAFDDEKGEAVGVMCYELYEDEGEIRIDWLQVKDEFRGIGIAFKLHTMLLSVAIDMAWVKRIVVLFPEEREAYRDMAILLKNLGYRWGNEEDEILMFKLNEVDDSVISSAKAGSEVVTLKEFIVENKKSINSLKNRWMNSPVNVWSISLTKALKEMDADCSIVVDKDNEIKAYALISKINDTVVLRNLSCAKDSPRYLAQVLSKAVNAIREKYGEDTYIETTVINAESKKLFDKLVSNYSIRHNASLALKLR